MTQHTILQVFNNIEGNTTLFGMKNGLANYS